MLQKVDMHAGTTKFWEDSGAKNIHRTSLHILSNFVLAV
jgi:hypothetical protein